MLQAPPKYPDAFTLPDIVEDIYSHLEKVSLDNILSAKKVDDVYRFLGFAGMGIRNTYGMWNEKSKTHNWFFDTYGLKHADDMSGLVIEGLWHRVHNKTYDPLTTVERYRKYWKKYGLNLDQTEIKK